MFGGGVMRSQDGMMGLERFTYMSCLLPTCDGVAAPALRSDGLLPTSPTPCNQRIGSDEVAISPLSFHSIRGMWCVPARQWAYSVHLPDDAGNATNPLWLHSQVGVSSLASSSDEDDDKERHELPEQEDEGEIIQWKRLAGLVEEDLVAARPRSKFVHFKWSQPISEALDYMHELLTNRVKRKSTTFPYIARCKWHFYEVHNTSSKIAATDLSQMEEIMRSIWVIQNFQFWIFGAFIHLVKFKIRLQNKDLLMAKAVDNMQKVMKDAAKESSLVLSNLVFFSREMTEKFAFLLFSIG
ncbi:hypothetical protein E2C01_042408 [Portunus trituberculatus]|uniref:Uncharacterized protein n=1 Tax=Portunus trituberculatus TaxID=210409 RepID=A0A5B7FTD7_PORTR|nr:hypothetical protein [Portunus trituberculatus]